MLNPAVSNLIKEMKKACPFCGGSAYLWRWGRKFDKTSRQYAVKCYRRYLTTDKDDMKYERFKQDMESCERSLISTIEFWQPAVDGKTAVEKVKADIRAERGV